MNNVKFFAICSFFFAIFGGFGLAGHLTSVLTLGFPIKKSYLALVQAHGHFQILGWVGLLIIGISLNIIPRLVSRPLCGDPKIIALLISTGILIRGISQILLSYFSNKFLSAGFFLGILLECTGIVSYILMIVKCLRVSNIKQPAVLRLLPYLFSSLIGWIGFTVINLISGWRTYEAKSFIISPDLKIVQTDIFLYMTLLPLTLLFSVKLLPLFLGLREPRWNVGGTGMMVLLSAAIKSLESFYHSASLSLVANTVLFLVLVHFIWQLDILRRHTPERLESQIQNKTLRGRGRLPDCGEYGKFELHIYAAYIWLLFAVILDLLRSMGIGITADAVRHTYFLGFISNLIFGVGFRMLPGMIGNKLRAPDLVLFGFFLLNLAAFGRIFPMLINIDAFRLLLKWSFAISGVFGLLAISLMSFNIFKLKKAGR